MTTDLLSTIAGSLLSLVFSYVPGVATWYNKLEPEYKRLVMLFTLFIVTLVMVLLNCTDKTGNWVCTQATIFEWLRVFIAALLANQSVDRISPFVGEKKRSEELSQL